jgi:flagellar motility protein MotE (MotC chaperone)
VTWLKEEMAKLKCRHETELGKAKEDYESQKIQAVNETIKNFETKIQRLKDLSDIERKLNDLQKQQVEALTIGGYKGTALPILQSSNN